MFLLIVCVCSLSSCSTLESVLNYFLKLPANLFRAITP